MYDQPCRVFGKLRNWWRENADCKVKKEGKIKLMQKALSIADEELLKEKGKHGGL